mmetsp:Transcript_6890/g.9864  ORF Transcript_6890/g.9864 Transcript_6890/m.9864 type:complete len:215 (-) Transcript_6890:504-1148(-)
MEQSSSWRIRLAMIFLWSCLLQALSERSSCCKLAASALSCFSFICSGDLLSQVFGKFCSSQHMDVFLLPNIPPVPHATALSGTVLICESITGTPNGVLGGKRQSQGMIFSSSSGLRFFFFCGRSSSGIEIERQSFSAPASRASTSVQISEISPSFCGVNPALRRSKQAKMSLAIPQRTRLKASTLALLRVRPCKSLTWPSTFNLAFRRRWLSKT